MPETEEVFSAREVAQALGVGAAMLRRYAQAYEVASGERIELHPRDGRIFSGKHLEVLQTARAIVQRDSSSVEAAVLQALERPEQSLELHTPNLARFDAEALTEALRRSQEPLLEKLSRIEAELRALRAERQSSLSRPSKEKRDKTESDFINDLDNDDFINDLDNGELEHTFIEPDDGVLVRWVRRLERFLRRG